MSLSTDEVCRRVGVTFRQLDYWDRIGLIGPSVANCFGTGTYRRWSEDDVLRVKIIKHLMAGRGKAWGPRIKKVMRTLPDEVKGRWLVIGTDHGSCVVNDHQLAKACARFGPGCLVIEVGEAEPARVRRAS